MPNKKKQTTEAVVATATISTRKNTKEMKTTGSNNAKKTQAQKSYTKAQDYANYKEVSAKIKNNQKAVSPNIGSVKFIKPLSDADSKNTIMKYNNGTKINSFKFDNLYDTMAANHLFPKDKLDYCDRYCRYGYIDPYNTEQVTREFLFFTKPDLYLYDNTLTSNYNSDLIPELQDIPFFIDADGRHRNALRQLQYSIKDQYNQYNPFMYLLSNCVTSKLDLGSISADSQESTSNIFGTLIQYRGHSLKSDNGYDFTLSFSDNAYLQIYTMIKAYDEYVRLLKLGEIAPRDQDIINRRLIDQFSIYKFLVGNDGETILYYAKLTGCYFTDVPRSDLSDPGNDGIKFSLSFHAQFIEDSNPLILSEFNRISPYGSKINGDGYSYLPVYDSTINAVNNEWARFPKIIRVDKGNDIQVRRRGTNYDYRIKWFK